KATINVSRTGGGDGSVTVHYKTLNGTGTAGTDYTTATGTLTFPPYPSSGWSNQVFTVPILNNGIANPDRTVLLQIYTPAGGAALGVTNSQLLIINANYSAGSVNFAGGIVVATNLMTYGTNENAGTAVITVSRLGGNTGTLIASVASGGGTAVNGVNYIGFTNQITWNSGQAGPTNIIIPILDDGVVTSNLTFNLRIFGTTVNSSASSLAMGAYTNAIFTITNVDALGTLQFSLPGYSFNKDGGPAIIPVTRVGGSSGTISVHYATLDGSAASNIDYVETNGTLTFANGEVAKTFEVPIINNSIQEGNQYLNLILTNFSPTNVLGSPSNATLTIIDTDTYNEPPGSVDTGYNPLAGFNNSVFALALEPSDNKLLVGGDFTLADGVGRNRIARLNPDGTLDNKFSSYLPSQGASDVVRALAVQTDGRILVGGDFTNFNGSLLSHIARLNYNGSLDSTFNPGAGANNTVYALAETFVGGQREILIAGDFTTIRGLNYSCIARLNDDGSV
ncbi:MAG TPA: Calx-beta domain-containing protein, partial [Phycisphaerae bacterium]|nr:Calx-beta domain-containing protein [Phycisphaerae bacterium]